MSTRSVRYSTFNRSIRKGNLASTDRDALAFLEAAQIYNTNQQRAIVNLVRSLKRVGLWSKMKAIYPFIGGTASSHKWNLKDPRDVDAAFRLTFSGGWTHSANGAKPNGTNGYADTAFNPRTHLTAWNASLGFYNRTATIVNDYEQYMGIENNSNELFLLSAWKSPASQRMYFNGIAVTYSTTNYSGFWIGSKLSQSSYNKLILNGNVIGTATALGSNVAMPNNNIPIGATYNNGFYEFYSQFQCAFATIGDGLTDTDATNLYNIVDLYQKRLGRAV